jgi:hypothetical protein
MENKLNRVVNAISSELSREKAYEIPYVCGKYALEPEEEYSSPMGKEKYLRNVLLGKSENFLLELANKVVNDYQSDSVGLALNQYYGGKYFKLSVVTRNDLIAQLYAFGSLQGNLSKDEFLKACNLEQFVTQNMESILSYLQSSQPPEKDLIEVLKEMRLQDKLDARFFNFLEQVVHPYTRSNVQAQPYLTLINKFLRKDGMHLVPVEDISGEAVYKVFDKHGMNKAIKNLVFAANGYKPEIVLDDALSNEIRIVKNAEYCLIYDRPIKPSGLLWVELVDWWSTLNQTTSSLEQALNLRDRLRDTLASEPERVLFNTYYSVLSKQFGQQLPALIPQVYLHYDPYSIKQHGISYLLRQRMDFLILTGKSRIVIEVDGKQHYANGDTASPKNYAEMVSLDRELKLLGYEVYRFGGYELTSATISQQIDFFRKLFIKHNIIA